MDYKYIKLLTLVRQLGEAEGSSLATGSLHALYEERASNLRIKVKEKCVEMDIDPTDFHPYI